MARNKRLFAPKKLFARKKHNGFVEDMMMLEKMATFFMA